MLDPFCIGSSLFSGGNSVVDSFAASMASCHWQGGANERGLAFRRQPNIGDVDGHKMVESSGRNKTGSVGARGAEEKEDGQASQSYSEEVRLGRLLKNSRMPRCCQFSEDRKEPSAGLMGVRGPHLPASRSAPDKLGDTARAEN